MLPPVSSILLIINYKLIYSNKIVRQYLKI